MKSPKFQLLIETNEYTGNFERDLLAYVFGYLSDCGHDWTENLNKLAEKELDKEFLEELHTYFHHYYDQYGPTIGEITGKEANSFIIYFDKEITEGQFNIIKERIYKFPEVLAKSWEFAPKNVEIKNVVFGEFSD